MILDITTIHIVCNSSIRRISSVRLQSLDLWLQLDSYQ